MTYNRITFAVGLLLLGPPLAGCGNTKSQLATQQLLLSDSVDRAVSSIDFRPLTGKTVFLDTKYIAHVKGDGVVNYQYLTSALRQQMIAASCHLEDSMDKADYVVEVRVGAMGSDSHEVTYGIPASSALSSAASLVPNAPSIPIVPEISVAKRSDDAGATKLAVFAYHRESRLPVWQSGIAQARSKAKNTWLFGAGPFQSGTVYDHTQFAGEELDIPLIPDGKGRTRPDPLTMYTREVEFVQPSADTDEQPIQPAAFQQPAPPPGATPAAPAPAAPAPAAPTAQAPATPAPGTTAEAPPPEAKPPAAPPPQESGPTEKAQG